MSDFKKVSDWLVQNIKSLAHATDLPVSAVEDILAMADNEDPKIKEAIVHILLNEKDAAAIVAFAGLKPIGFKANPVKPVDNGFAGVIVKRDDNSTDGIVTIICNVPGYYGLRTIIRLAPDKTAKVAVTSFIRQYGHSRYDTNVYHATCAGSIMNEIFECKDAVDSGKPLVAPLPPASKKESNPTITLPDGTVVPQYF